MSDDFQQENKQIPWSDIIGQRNIIAYQYEKVDQKRIW
ncbi:HepT-like ribonuclease domain-containing protein [Cyanobacterium aponinum]